MKRVLTICMIFMAVMAMEAQTVAVIDFMKVPANGGDAYMAVEKQWKTLHQSRVDAGEILGWELYWVRNSGTDSQYNFATATIYENFSKTENFASEAEMKKAFGDKMDDFMKKTDASRNLIYSEDYFLQVGIPGDVPDKYLVINHVQTDNVDNYINMEKVGYMPLHQEAKKLGQRNSWGIWTRWPNNDNSFQAVAIDGYTKFTDINGGDYGKALDNILPSKKSGEIFDMMNQINKTDQIRKFVKTEIWELVDTTTPKKK
jgi:hypothetical protein